jgi:hypothetical protein
MELKIMKASLLALAVVLAAMVASPVFAAGKYDHPHRKHHPHHKAGKPYDHPHWKHHKKPPKPNPQPEPEPEPEPEPGPLPGPPSVFIANAPNWNTGAHRETMELRSNEPVEFYCEYVSHAERFSSSYVYSPEPCGSGTEASYVLDDSSFPVAQPTRVVFRVEGVDSDGEVDGAVISWYQTP